MYEIKKRQCKDSTSITDTNNGFIVLRVCSLSKEIQFPSTVFVCLGNSGITLESSTKSFRPPVQRIAQLNIPLFRALGFWKYLQK